MSGQAGRHDYNIKQNIVHIAMINKYSFTLTHTGNIKLKSKTEINQTNRI